MYDVINRFNKQLNLSAKIFREYGYNIKGCECCHLSILDSSSVIIYNVM